MAARELVAFTGFLTGAVLLAIVAGLICRDIVRGRRKRLRLFPALLVCVSAAAVNAAYLVLLLVTRVPDWRSQLLLQDAPVTTVLFLSPLVGLGSILVASWLLVTTYRASLLDAILKHALAALVTGTAFLSLERIAGPPGGLATIANPALARAMVAAGVLGACLFYTLVLRLASMLVDRLRRRPSDASLRLLLESATMGSVESVGRLLPAIATAIEQLFDITVAEALADRDTARALASRHDGACVVDEIEEEMLYRRFSALAADALVIVGDADAGCGVIAVRRRGSVRASDFRLLQAIGREATRLHRRLEVEEGRRTAAIAHETAVRLAAEARLASLRAQINPHFLFNTLNAIAALIETNPSAAERLIEDLSDVLRRVVMDGRDVVALEDELELVDTYLEIERARLGYPLAYETRLSPSTARRLIPTFSIQPLVENAVRHGVVPKQAPCTIKVSVERRDDELLIQVTDDGVGHAGAIRKGTGLRNVGDRLSALYGPAHTVAFESRPGAGATASFTVPC